MRKKYQSGRSNDSKPGRKTKAPMFCDIHANQNPKNSLCDAASCATRIDRMQFWNCSDDSWSSDITDNDAVFTACATLCDKDRILVQCLSTDAPLPFTPQPSPAAYHQTAALTSIFRNGLMEQQVCFDYNLQGMELPQSMTNYYSAQYSAQSRNHFGLKLEIPTLLPPSPPYYSPSTTNSALSANSVDSDYAPFTATARTLSQPYSKPTLGKSATTRNASSARRITANPRYIMSPSSSNEHQNPLITQLMAPKFENQTDPVFKSFPCACSKQFERLCGLKSHIKVHLKKGHILQQSELESKMEWVGLDGLVITASPEDSGRSHICNLCPKDFLRRQDLRRHVQSSHSNIEKTLKCESCDAIFSRSDALHRHITSKRCKTA